MRRFAIAALVVALGCSRQKAPDPEPDPASDPDPDPATTPDPAPDPDHDQEHALEHDHEDAAPRPDDLVDIATVAPDIAVEMRYATPDNFAKVAVYPVAKCLLRRDAAERLARAQASLARRGHGLKVWDCYRPFSIQKRFWALVPDARYVAEPVTDAAGKPVTGSKHNRGAAVDVTLVDGEMPTAHDDFSPRAHRGNKQWSAAARANAALLDEAMRAEGFEPLPTEWWHYDAPGWKAYPLSDEPIR